LKLAELIKDIEVKEYLNFSDTDITGISADSQSIRRGELFAAVRGHSADGHDFIKQATDRGAVALVVERSIETSLPTVIVTNSAVATALMAKRLYNDPASRVVLVGITGTNGKTSSSFLLRSILNRSVGPTGIIGTVGIGSRETMVATTHTTPASVDLYRIIADFLGKGCRAVAMEVSSHAADQDRIAGLEFDVGVFTNISRDHLDYHETFENYLAAKEKFVKTLQQPGRVKEQGILAYNMDDERLVSVAGRFGGSKVSFGLRSHANVRAEGLEADLRGTRFDLVIGSSRGRVELKLLGAFSAYNALAAAAAAHALGIDLEDIRAGLEDVAEVPGRFQVVSTGKGPTVVVDYAHTPDALDRLLRFCRELSPKRIYTVFGCGGDRDRGKRPMMGSIAAELSDTVFVTDDNPRTEDPDKIVDAILQGMKGGMGLVHVVRDRKEAIHRAISAAREGEMVVIAGKGHEDYQILKDRRVPFSDIKVAMNALKSSEVNYQS